MAISIRSNEFGGQRAPLRPAAALRAAWYWYLTLLFIPFILAMAVILTMNYETAMRNVPASHGWFIAAIIFLLVGGPTAFIIRSRLFKSYWQGKGVNPRSYLLGMVIVWMTFEIGGLISLVGCLMSNSLVPCILPALASFMFFTPLWPNGRAMAQTTGNSDDPELYQEPR